MSEITREEALAHFGVKGMRWGVRNAYVARQRKQSAHVRRVAEGEGSALDKYRTSLKTSAGSLAKNKGLQGAAKKKIEKQDAMLQRLESGNAKTKDILTMYGTIRMSDLVKGQKRVA